MSFLRKHDDDDGFWVFRFSNTMLSRPKITSLTQQHLNSANYCNFFRNFLVSGRRQFNFFSPVLNTLVIEFPTVIFMYFYFSLFRKTTALLILPQTFNLFFTISHFSFFSFCSHSFAHRTILQFACHFTLPKFVEHLYAFHGSENRIQFHRWIFRIFGYSMRMDNLHLIGKNNQLKWWKSTLEKKGSWTWQLRANCKYNKTFH